MKEVQLMVKSMVYLSKASIPSQRKMKQQQMLSEGEEEEEEHPKKKQKQRNYRKKVVDLDNSEAEGLAPVKENKRKEQLLNKGRRNSKS